MAAELPRPGVEVIQVLRTVSPTVVTPTLVPCVVGVCKQLLDLYTQSASGANQLNSDALTTVPAMLISVAAAGAPEVFTGLDGLDLVLSINNGPDVTTTFSDPSTLGLSPASVASQVNAALAAESITEAVAGYDDNTHRWFLRTVGTGETQTIEVRPTSGAAVLSAFGGADPASLGWAENVVTTGVSSYDGHALYVDHIALPDPKGNLSEITIEPDTLRVFLAGGGSASNIRELSRTSAFLRHGAGQTAARVVGSVDLSTLVYGVGGDLDAKVLVLAIDGAPSATVTFGTGATAPADKEDVIAQINDALKQNVASITTVGGNPHLALSSIALGPSSSVQVVSGSAMAILGLTAGTTSGVASVIATDDGDGDATTPLITCTGYNFTLAESAASAVGILDLSAPGALAALNGTTLTLSVDGKPAQTMTLGTYLAAGAFHTAVQDFFGSTLLSVSGATTQTFASLSSGESSSLQFIGGTALPYLGLVPYIDAAFAATAWRDAGVAGGPFFAAVAGKKLRVNANGTIVEHTFGAGPYANMAAVVASLTGDAVFSAAVKASETGDVLRLELLTGGENAFLTILAATSAESCYLFGWHPGQTVTFSQFYGRGYKPVSGDDLYVDGVLVGRILKVAPGGVTSQVKLDKEVSINATYGDSFYMIAKRLPRTSPLTGPSAELVVDGYGNYTISPFVLRDTLGSAVVGVPQTIYSTFRAVRKDVTALATRPGLLRMDSTTALEATIAPVSAENPLALGMYLALLNAPTIQVTGLGVDAISADSPYGTVEAFTRAAEFLEAYEVYAIAPMTHEAVVGQVFDAHVKAMSEPENKGERICLFNWAAPSHAVDTLVASGEGNNPAPSSPLFNTGVANLGALLLAQGVSPVGTIPASAGAYLDIFSDDKHYSIQSVAGGTITIRTVFAAGENDDGFYATVLPATLLVDEVFSVRVRGAALTVAGVPDKQKMAETYQTMALGVKNRRFWSIMPDKCAATVGGIEQQLEGFYMCAAIAGMIGRYAPQQSFTNFPMAGFTKVIGSNDYFTNKQLNVIAGGGNYIIVQDAAGVPLSSRMALTTDITSLETRTDSIVKIADYTAKFLRSGLKNFIGRFNINGSFTDTLSHVCQGLLTFLADTGVIIDGQLTNIIQDENNRDTVLIDVTLEVPAPCNYIRLVLTI